MGWILMQPSRDKESTAALETLQNTGECEFDLSIDGARLKPIAFGSRSCTTAESKLHSFTGEAACGRWAIAQNKKSYGVITFIGYVTAQPSRKF